MFLSDEITFMLKMTKISIEIRLILRKNNVVRGEFDIWKCRSWRTERQLGYNDIFFRSLEMSLVASSTVLQALAMHIH